MLKIGFIGTGMIAKATITAFCERERSENYPIIISNRTKSACEEIAKKYPDRITVADSFQECADKSDIVVVAVLPGAGEEVFRSIRFKPEHRIVTMISTMAKEEVEPLLNTKVENIVHMIPGTFVSVVPGPIIAYPKDAVIEEVFGKIGTIVSLEDRSKEKIAMSITGMFAPVFSIEDTMISWCKDKGLDEADSVSYVTSLFKALAEEACMENAEGIHRLATVNTPGGINMQSVEQITNAGGFKAFHDALDKVLERLEG